MFRRIIWGCLLFPLWVCGHGDVTVATQEALQSALEGGGLVRILTTNTITVTNTLTISVDTTIEGVPGATISGGGTTRIFTVGNGVKLRASNLSFVNGLAAGIRLIAEGENSHLFPSSGTAGQGGAILAETAELHFTNCNFAGNRAIGGAGGAGGIYGGGSTGSGEGGAIHMVNSTAYITNCYFGTNIAQSGELLGPTRATHPASIVSPALGGAIFAFQGNVVVRGSEFTGNLANVTNSPFPPFSIEGGEASGGAIYAKGGRFELVESNLKYNQASSIFGIGGGGGIWIQCPSVVGRSSFFHNVGATGGGLFLAGPTFITNSTFFLNRASSNGLSIFSTTNDVLLANASLYANNGAPGIANIAATNGARTRVHGSIFEVQSQPPVNLNPVNFAGPVEDLGYNISSDSSGQFTSSKNNTFAGFQTHSLTTEPYLLLRLDSPAVDAIPLSEAPTTDQLGFPRVGGKADVGAREVGPNVLQWQHSAGFMAGWVGDSTGIEWSDLIWPLGNNVSIGSDWKVVQTGDYNGDGTSDLLWRSTGGHLGVWPIANLGLQLQGTATSLQAPVVGPEWRVVGWRDLDGDNDFDLWWQGPGGVQGIWWMNGNAFSSGVILTNLPLPGNDWQVVKLADFNGDNAVDLLWQSQSSGALGIWHLDAQRRLVGTPGMFLNTHDPVLLNVGPEWKLVSVIDYDMDGIHDLIWQHNGNGMVAWWGLDDQRRPVASKMKLISDLVPGKDWRLINVITP